MTTTPADRTGSRRAFFIDAADKPAWVSRKDRTGIRYNAYLTIHSIPETENGHRVGGRSPLEWALDRYRVKTDKASGIVNHPSARLREHENPRCVVDHIHSLVTVSLEPQRLIAELPRVRGDRELTENRAVGGISQSRTAPPGYRPLGR